MDASMPDKYITQYQDLHRKHFGTGISREEAEKKFAKLVRLARVVRDHRAAMKTYTTHDKK